MLKALLGLLADLTVLPYSEVYAQCRRLNKFILEYIGLFEAPFIPTLNDIRQGQSEVKGFASIIKALDERT